MTNDRTPLAERVYRALLRLFPVEFRTDFGSEMEEVFRLQRHDAARRPERTMARLWIRTLAGIFRTAPAEHLELLRQDVGYALRVLRRSPGFAAAAVLTLALGIGANAAIFSAVDPLLLRPLPVAAPDRLVLVTEDRGADGINHNFSYPDFRDYLQRNHSLDPLMAYAITEAAVTTAAGTERIRGEAISENFFAGLGVTPSGRAFTTLEATQPDRSRVVVLSEALRNRLFTAERVPTSRTVVLNGQTFTVVGVAPAWFQGMSVGERAEFWVPLAASPVLSPTQGNPLTARGMSWLTLLGRLRPRLSPGDAAKDLAAVERHVQADARLRRERRLVVGTGRQGDSMLPGLLQRPLVLLTAVAAIVLALVCSNVAGLLLARATGRGREIAMRLALGAGRGRLIRQMLTESLVLALLGGAGGLVVGWLAAGGLAFLLSPGRDPLIIAGLDLRVLGFTFGVSVVAGLLFGAVPAAHALSGDLAGTMKRGALAGQRGRRRLSIRHALVAVQVALSLVLLVPAGLLFQTLLNLSKVDIGMASNELLLLSVNLESAADTDAAGTALYGVLSDRLRAVPGVRDVALATSAPVDEAGSRMTVFVPGYRPGRDEDMDTNFMRVDAAYFRTLGVSLVRGRSFTTADRRSTRPVAVINETMARRYWRGQDPIGRMVGFESLAGPFDTEVVGIVRDAKYRSLREPSQPSFYVALAQNYRPWATVHLRTSLPPRQVVPAVRQALLVLDKRLALSDIRTMGDQIGRAASRERFAAALCGCFAALALLLSLVGLAGLMSYTVGQRTQEIGVRMAMGASTWAIRAMVIREGMVPVALGALVGIAGAVAATGAVENLLYGVRRLDPLAIVGTLGLLVATALIACEAPARRAARVDPVAALRAE